MTDPEDDEISARWKVLLGLPDQEELRPLAAAVHRDENLRRLSPSISMGRTLRLALDRSLRPSEILFHLHDDGRMTIRPSHVYAEDAVQTYVIDEAARIAVALPEEHQR